LRFVDGRVTNPANQTKNNLQVDYADPKYAESVQIVNAALSRSREFVDFAMPKRVAPPLLARYEAGMKYGAHATCDIQLAGGRLRSDISCTVFVNDPATYEGGELSIMVGNRPMTFTCAGDAIAYPRPQCTKPSAALANAWLSRSLRKLHRRPGTSAQRSTN
jgi:PKHD-type hydroxylase